MKPIGDLIPKDPEKLKTWAETQPTITVTCPSCNQDWERHGSTLPAGFDGICPECYDRGIRPGTFRRTSAPADRRAFLAYIGCPSILSTPFRDRQGEPGEPAR